MPELEFELFHSLGEAMPLGLCLVDLRGKILFWNAAAEAITGYMRAETVGRSYRGDLLIHWEEQGARVQCPVAEVLRDGRAVEAELFLRHKQGHRLPMRVFAFPLRDEDGEVRGVGELLDPMRSGAPESEWGGYGEREVESATGLPAVAETRERLHALMGSPHAGMAGLVLIEMQQRESILQYGGAAMLHQGMRVLARTVSGLLPARHFLGCWSDGRMLAILPECTPELLLGFRQKLAGIGSSCAVKWWGDRVTVAIRAAAGVLGGRGCDELLQALEQELERSSERSGESCSSS